MKSVVFLLCFLDDFSWYDCLRNTPSDPLDEPLHECGMLFVFLLLCFLGDIFLFVFGVCEKNILDEQFIQLQQLQDESNPDFVVEVVSLFFEDSERLLNELAKALWVINLHN